MDLKTYTVQDLAEALGISVTTIYRIGKKWPHMVIGGSIRFTEAQVAEIVEMMTVHPIENPPEPPYKRYGVMSKRGPKRSHS